MWLSEVPMFTPVDAKLAVTLALITWLDSPLAAIDSPLLGRIEVAVDGGTLHAGDGSTFSTTPAA